MRRAPVPLSLRGHARACVDVAAQAARFFRAPSEAGAFAVREAALSARRAGTETAAVLGSSEDARRRDWLALSRRLAEAASAAGSAALEAGRFGVGDARLAPAAAALRDATRELESALGALGEVRQGEALVVSAKRKVAEAEALIRRGRDSALDEPDAVLDLKLRTVLRSLGRCADALQGAADRLAELVGVTA